MRLIVKVGAAQHFLTNYSLLFELIISLGFKEITNI